MPVCLNTWFGSSDFGVPWILDESTHAFGNYVGYVVKILELSDGHLGKIQSLQKSASAHFQMVLQIFEVSTDKWKQLQLDIFQK